MLAFAYSCGGPALSNTGKNRYSPRCPNCGGYVTATSPLSVPVWLPLPDVYTELGECDSCHLRVQRTGEGPWRVNPTPIDDRLDQPLTPGIESRVRSRNGLDWAGFVNRMTIGDELWTLKTTFSESVVIAVVNKGMIKELKRFKR